MSTSNAGSTRELHSRRNTQALKQAPRNSRSKSSKTECSSCGSLSKKREHVTSSSEDSEDSNVIVQKQEKHKSKAGMDAKEKERRAG